jgi:hypothetical protein
MIASGLYQGLMTRLCGSGTYARGNKYSYCMDTSIAVSPVHLHAGASHCSTCACMHPHVVISVDLSPTGSMLATGDEDRHVKLCVCLPFVHTSCPCGCLWVEWQGAI